MNFLKQFLSKFKRVKPVLPIKDPNDFTLTISSTDWGNDQCCPHCKATIGFNEYMACVCNTCGGFHNILDLRRRSFRQIFNGEKWIWQYRYLDGKCEMLDTPIHTYKQ